MMTDDTRKPSMLKLNKRWVKLLDSTTMMDNVTFKEHKLFKCYDMNLPGTRCYVDAFVYNVAITLLEGIVAETVNIKQIENFLKEIED